MHRALRNGLIVFTSWSVVSVLGAIVFLMVATGLLDGLIAGAVFGVALALGGIVPGIFAGLISLITTKDVVALAVPLGAVIALSIPDILSGPSGFEDIGPAIGVFLLVIATLTLILSIAVLRSRR